MTTRAFWDGFEKKASRFGQMLGQGAKLRKATKATVSAQQKVSPQPGSLLNRGKALGHAGLDRAREGVGKARAAIMSSKAAPVAKQIGKARDAVMKTPGRALAAGAAGGVGGTLALTGGGSESSAPAMTPQGYY